MAAIRAKNTKPEIVVRKYLWSRGFRYRLNHPRLPGKPDIVLRKYRTCIFVNGCFWHGHNLLYDNPSTDSGQAHLPGCDEDNFPLSSECCKIPRTNREFWVKKITRNRERDCEVQRKLAEMGWHSIVVWECDLKPSCREKTLASLAYTLNHIFLQDHVVKRYEMEEDEAQLMVAEQNETEYGKN